MKVSEDGGRRALFALFVMLGTSVGFSQSPSTDGANRAPRADGGRAITVGTLPTTVALDGGGSTDLDGDLLRFEWRFLAVPEGSAATPIDPAVLRPTFTVDQPGTYVVQLTVHDGIAATEPATVTITTGNTAPVANAGADRSARVGTVVLLDGTGSSDADNDPLTFEWSVTTGPPGSTATRSGGTSAGPSLLIDVPGTYVVQLLVNDGLATSVPDTVVISTSNTRPIADAGTDRRDVPAGSDVALDGSLSGDPDGWSLRYSWWLIARPNRSAATLADADTAAPTLSPDVPGDYVAQLIVRDGLADSEPDTVVIQVRSAALSEIAGADGLRPSETVVGSALPPASLVGSWSGSTGQDPARSYRMWVDLDGVIGVNTSVFGTSASCQVFPIFNVLPAAAITNDAFTINFSVTSGGTTIGTGVVAGSFGSDTTATGIIDVTYFAPSPCAPLHTTWSASKVDGGPISVVTVSATDPNAAEAGSDNGVFTITRAGSLAEPLTVHTVTSCRRRRAPAPITSRSPTRSRCSRACRRRQSWWTQSRMRWSRDPRRWCSGWSTGRPTSWAALRPRR